MNGDPLLVYLDDFSICCPADSNTVVEAGVNGVGCCNDLEEDTTADLYCCVDGFIWDLGSRTCI